MPAVLTTLDDGTVIAVETSDILIEGADGLSADGLPSLKELLKKLVGEVGDGLKAAAPTEATLKVGVKAAVDSSGAVKWVFGKVSGETTIEVTLTWK